MLLTGIPQNIEESLPSILLRPRREAARHRFRDAIQTVRVSMVQPREIPHVNQMIVFQAAAAFEKLSGFERPNL